MRISDWSSDVCSSDLGGDRRQFVLETIAVAERQSCRRLESPERTALDLAAVEQTVTQAQGVARIPGFLIVLRSEQALAAGLALAAGDRAQRVETASDGGDEALLRLHVGRHRPEQRRLLLVGAVGPPEPLDRAVGLPASLQQIMDTQPLVPRAEIGMVAAAGAARVREDKIGRAHV